MNETGRSGTGKNLALAVLVVTGVLVGCGGDDGSSDSPRSGDDGSSQSGGTRGGPDLPRAVLPRCKFPQFGEPQVRELESPTGGGQAWQVAYLPPSGGATPAPAPADTKQVMIVEESPRLTQFGVQGGRTQTVAGRKVSIRPPTPESVVYAAQWNTKRARYTMLVEAETTKVLKRFIACLP